MKEKYTRREFIRMAGLATAGLLTGCSPKKQPEVVPPSPEPDIPRPTLTAEATLAPTPTEISQLVLKTEANLVDLAERYPISGFKDEYYAWYCLNGGEKLFEPWKIPAGTTLLIPGKNQELLNQYLDEQKEHKETDWQYLLAENSTSLGNSSEARLRNVRTATSRLNGTLIQPYELFSVLKALGPFTGESVNGDEGYGRGMGYTNQGEVEMFAGGICQLPSTLFKASAKAGMLVVQRTAHYYRSYAEPWDATIEQDTNLDFTCRNLFPFTLMIEAEIKNNRVYTRIKSPQPLPYKNVVLETVYDRKNQDGSSDSLVRQTVTFKNRVRVREYSSHYEPKPKH